MTRSPTAFDWCILDVVVGCSVRALLHRGRRTDGRIVECGSCADPDEQVTRTFAGLAGERSVAFVPGAQTDVDVAGFRWAEPRLLRAINGFGDKIGEMLGESTQLVVGTVDA